MPTLMLFKAGQVVGQIVGAVPRAKIDALVGTRSPERGPATRYLKMAVISDGVSVVL